MADTTQPTDVYTLSFPYGAGSLPIIDTGDPAVPKKAQPINIPQEDKDALAYAVRKNKTVLLVGETGTGKTSIVKELAQKMGMPYVRVSMTGYTTPDELIGRVAVKNGSTYFEYGVITDAMRRGAFLVLDEINATTPDCTFILHALLDDDRVITLPNGQRIEPHPNFRVFATCNPDYEGTKTLNKAFIDRFPVILEICVLNPEAEKSLLMERTGISQDHATRLVTIGTMIRKDYTEGKLSVFCSTRSLLSIAELIVSGMEPQEAFTTGMVRKTSNRDEQKALKDFYCAVFKIASTERESDDIPVVTTQGELKKRENIQKELHDRINRILQEVEQVKKEAKDKARIIKLYKKKYGKLRNRKIKIEGGK